MGRRDRGALRLIARPWLVTFVVVVGAMILIAGISQLAAKAGSPSIDLSDR